jgi:hypothetical protein
MPVQTIECGVKTLEEHIVNDVVRLRKTYSNKKLTSVEEFDEYHLRHGELRIIERDASGCIIKYIVDYYYHGIIISRDKQVGTKIVRTMNF